MPKRSHSRGSGYRLALVLILQGPLTSPLCRSSEPLPIAQLLDLEVTSSAVLSPDGQWLAMIVSRVGSDGHAAGTSVPTPRRNTLRLLDIRTGQTLSPVTSNISVSTLAWSQSGSRLAFDGQEGGQHRLWVWSPRSAGAHAVGDGQLAGGNLVWSKDGSAVFATVSAEPVARGKTPSPGTQPASAAEVRVYRSSAGAQETQDYSSNDLLRADLARINVATGQLVRLTEGARPQSIRLSPNGRWIAFASQTGQLNGDGYRNLFDLSLASADATTPTRVLVSGIERVSHVMDFSWSPDSSTIAYTEFRLQGPSIPMTADGCDLVRVRDGRVQPVRFIQRGDERGFPFLQPPVWDEHGASLYLAGSRGLWRIDTATASARLLSALAGERIRLLVIPRDGSLPGTRLRSGALVAVTRNESSRQESLYRIEVHSGVARRLLQQAASLSSSPYKLDMTANGGAVLFSRQTSAEPEQFWLGNPVTGTTHPITHANPQLARYTFGGSRLLSWRGPYASSLTGSLVLPANAVPGQRYPLIVEVYPGEDLTNGLHIFGGNGGFASPLYHTQVLATRGFAVLQADTFVGEDTPMRDIADSVLSAVEAAVAAGVADPDRLGIVGHSYGGYAALATVVQTQRFKAAVVIGGFASLLTLYGEMHADGTHWSMSWVENGAHMGGTPWQIRQKYVENSPLLYFDRVATPILLIHGAEDGAVDPFLADEAFMALRRLGREVEYAKYLHEGHLLLKRADIIDATDRMTQWFQRQLTSTGGASAP